MKVTAVAGAALVLFAALPAAAAVSVLGGGRAQDCASAALAGLADEDAISNCDVALATEDLGSRDRGGTLINRGVMKLRLGRYEAAHADFDAGIALVPRVGEGWINRGAMFVGEKKYQDGLADLDRGLALGVKEPEKAYFNRALAYEGLDDEKSAYLDYQQALALKPGWAAPERELKRFTVSRR